MCKSLSDRSHRPKQISLLLTALAALLSGIPPLMAQEVPEQLPPKTVAAPKLEVSTTEWDFGVKWAGEKAETAITLRNAGDAPLKIERVKSSCGCTVADVKNKLLQPGESEQIVITYNTRSRREKVSQNVRVHSNDPTSPVTTITITGQVKQLVEASTPRGLDLGQLRRDDAITKSIELTCTYREPLKLRLKELRSEHFDVQLEEIEGGKRYKLSATTKPPLPDGTVRADVQLLTGLELVPEIPVRVWGSVQAPVAVTPKVLYVFGQRQESVKRMLRVTTRRQKPVRITGVTASEPAIKAEILPTGARGSNASKQAGVTTIRVTLPPADEFPAGGATITITTDDEEYPELVVPVRKHATARTLPGVQNKARAAPRTPLSKGPRAVAP